MAPLNDFDGGEGFDGVVQGGITPDDDGAVLQLDIYPANGGPLSMKSPKERPSEVEIPKSVCCQDEVKTLERIGRVEILQECDGVGEHPRDSESAEEWKGWTQRLGRLTTSGRAEFEVVQGTVMADHGFDLWHLGIAEWISADDSKTPEGGCEKYRGVPIASTITELEFIELEKELQPVVARDDDGSL